MKTVWNGKVVEGTVEEIKKLIGGQKVISAEVDKLEIEDFGDDKPTVKREYYSRESLNWDNIVKDAKRVLKDTMKPYKISVLLKEARGLTSSSNISGKHIAIFRKYLKNNMWGIKKVGTDYMHRLVAGKGKKRYAKTDVHSKRMRWVCSRTNALMGIDNLSRTDAMRKACAEWRNNRGNMEFIMCQPKDIKKPDNRVKRARFICSRAGHLMKNNVHLSRSDALRRASDEWNTQGFKKNVINAKEKKSKPFLKFESINSQYDTILQGIINNVIKNKGEIKYNDVNYTLDLSDYRQWHDFIAEFMSKSHLISAYFNVENKFKHNRVGRYDTISYGSNGVY